MPVRIVAAASSHDTAKNTVFLISLDKPSVLVFPKSREVITSLEAESLFPIMKKSAAPMVMIPKPPSSERMAIIVSPQGVRCVDKPTESSPVTHTQFVAVKSASIPKCQLPSL